MKKTTRIILFTVIALFILGMALFPHIKSRFFNTPEAVVSAPVSGGGRTPLNVNARIIQPKVLIDITRPVGNIIPDEEVELTFEASGKITEISFKEGSSVKKGQLLAKVNDAPLQAELKKLEAQLPLYNERVKRQGTLLKKDAVSQESFEQVTTELEKLKADIELVKSRIAQTELRAPFDGVIGLRQMSEGAYASPGTVIATLTKITPLKIEFSVNEQYINDIKPGMKITFNTRDDLSRREASIYAVESNVDVATRSLKARATYPNTQGLLKPGGMADIEIHLSEISNALTVPNEAAIAEMGRDIVYIYQNGRARQVEIHKGMRSSSELQVIEGLNIGDTLITTGVMQLRDGLPVQIDKILE
ncbi:efflux RND transporter periplasmic adaptor subunit [Bacteroidales bacterium OttesenSCG-928-I14]|nr:efflux RND transporter periplasmic adaptor subunit [Bacteroidales bacterium OttesenSCG-928-I14]